MNYENFRFRVFRPIIINLHQVTMVLIEEEEKNMQEVKTLLTTPYKARIKSELEIELMLLQAVNQKMEKMLRLHKELKNTLEEYLELRGWHKP